jgi:hypothetical protein
MPIISDLRLTIDQCCDRCGAYYTNGGYHSWGRRLCETCYYDPAATPPSAAELVPLINRLRDEISALHAGDCPVYLTPPARFFHYPRRVRAGYE